MSSSSPGKNFFREELGFPMGLNVKPLSGVVLAEESSLASPLIKGREYAVRGIVAGGIVGGGGMEMVTERALISMR